MQNRNPNSLFGIDINEYSQNVNFPTLARNVDFLYLRASGSGSGSFRLDRRFIEFAGSSRDYGIPVGAYHYALPTTSLPAARAQADDFIYALQQGFGEGDFGDLLPVLDVEEPLDRSLTTTQLINWIEAFRERFEEVTRRRLMLYTGAFFIDLYDNFYVPGVGFPLSDMPLWIAMYTRIPGNPPYPVDQGGWTSWTIWQFSDEGRVNGVSSPTDLNWGPDNIDVLTPPRNVTGFRVFEDENNLYLTWDPNTDSDIAGYNIFLNGNYVATLNKDRTTYVLSKRDRNISPGEVVTLGVEAFDTKGDFSNDRTVIEIVTEV